MPPALLRLRYRILGNLTFKELMRETWKGYRRNEISVRAAATAYYALVALVPFLALVVTLAANLVPNLNATDDGKGVATGTLTVNELRQGLSRILPGAAHDVVTGELAAIQQQPAAGLVSISLLLSLWYSSGLFGTMIDAMNRIRGVEETRPYWQVLLVSVVLALMEAIFLLAVLALMVIWPQIRHHLGWGPPSSGWSALLEWVTVAIGSMLSLSLVSYLGSSDNRRWRWVTLGNAVGTAAFLVSSLLLRIYVQHFGSYNKTYGSLAGVILLSFWFWAVGLILLVALQIDTIIEESRGAQV